MLPACERYGMAVIPWSPLAGGCLSGRYRRGAEATESRRVQMLPQRFDMSRPENRRKIEAVYELTDLADEAGLTMIQLALGFVLGAPGGHRPDHRPAHDGAPGEPARPPPT